MGKSARFSTRNSVRRHMNKDSNDDLQRYIVVKNEEDQFSIWFEGRELPLGWVPVGKVGSKRECLTFIKAEWIDMRPASLKVLMVDRKDLGSQELEPNVLMKEDLWDYMAEKAENDIQASGWISSYTSLPFSAEEMKEYQENTLFKLEPYLSEKIRVLEVGCGSGITLQTIAPKVGAYVATDLSRGIVERTQKKVAELGLNNTHVMHFPAHTIDQVPGKDFDLIVMNSVIHCFQSLSYLKNVIAKAIDKLKPKGGLLFIGDVMDSDSKEALIDSLKTFKQSHPEKGYKTKTTLDAELFVAKTFFEELKAVFPRIYSVQHSSKKHTIPNELSSFRYDVILKINEGLKEAALKTK